MTSDFLPPGHPAYCWETIRTGETGIASPTLFAPLPHFGRHTQETDGAGEARIESMKQGAQQLECSGFKQGLLVDTELWADVKY